MRFRSSDPWVVEKQEEKAEEDTGFRKLEVTGCLSFPVGGSLNPFWKLVENIFSLQMDV